jgi:hypothetical protein
VCEYVGAEPGAVRVLPRPGAVAEGDGWPTMFCGAECTGTWLAPEDEGPAWLVRAIAMLVSEKLDDRRQARGKGAGRQRRGPATRDNWARQAV